MCGASVRVQPGRGPAEHQCADTDTDAGRRRDRERHRHAERQQHDLREDEDRDTREIGQTGRRRDLPAATSKQTQQAQQRVPRRQDERVQAEDQELNRHWSSRRGRNPGGSWSGPSATDPRGAGGP